MEEEYTDRVKKDMSRVKKERKEAELLKKTFKDKEYIIESNFNSDSLDRPCSYRIVSWSIYRKEHFWSIRKYIATVNFDSKIIEVGEFGEKFFDEFSRFGKDNDFNRIFKDYAD